MKRLLRQISLIAALLLLSVCAWSADYLTYNDFEIRRVFQTTGQGNNYDAILRIRLMKDTENPVLLNQITVELTDEAFRNVGQLHVYMTENPEFYAVENPQIVSWVVPKKKEVKMRIKDNVYIGKNTYLWLTCRVKNNAVIGETIDAGVKQVVLQQNKLRMAVDVPKQDGYLQGQGLKIFKQQQFLFVPTTFNCRFYRIPAMVLDRKGNIIVAADCRYDSNGDLGEHKIDVAVRRSEDNGRTWTKQQIVAKGDGVSSDAFGYGDAALVRTNTGRIVCVMAAGKNNFFKGMRNIGITVSDDDGKTWAEPRELTASSFTDAVHNLTDSLGFWSIFATSGKGLCLPDGRILFAANCISMDGTYNIDCYILSSEDNGESWTLGPQCAYKGCDESKLELMNDGSLLLSVRQDGDRGFNKGGYDAESWQQQWRTSDMSGNACNADMLYYSREIDGEKDIILHTLCNSPERNNLTLYKSTDKGRTWQEMMNIQRGGAAYSTMIKLPNGDVAVFYEDDSYSAGNGYHLNYIVIAKEQIVF